MIQTLTALDGGFALELDPALLDRLRIDGQTPLKMTAEGDRLIFRPAPTEADADTIAASSRRLMTVHAETFRKLAE